MNTSKSFLEERLAQGTVICAEGYIFELERRGYLSAGEFVPEVVLESPEAVKNLHREFVRAGSDVVEALTYYAHREKLKLVGKEDILEQLQKQAIRLAQEVACEFPEENPLVAGNISNTNIWDSSDVKSSEKIVRPMFEEQVRWAKEAGVDYIVAETFCTAGEAQVACDVISQEKIPVVLTIAPYNDVVTRDNVSYEKCFELCQKAGALVLGLNCARGPATMLPILQRLRSEVSCYLAALPVVYRTSLVEPIFQNLKDKGCSCIPEGRPYPTALEPFVCNRYEVSEFTKACMALDIRYLGLCCGAGPYHIRSMAETLGKTTRASRFTPDLSKHYVYGKKENLKPFNKDIKDTFLN